MEWNSLGAEQPVEVVGLKSGAAERYAHSNGLYWGTPDSTDALQPGFYRPVATQMGPAVSKLDMSTDNLLELPDPTCDALLREFVAFWTRAEQMRKRGFSLKRGIFLQGKPGGGKTSAIQRMSAHMINEMGGVVVLITHPTVSAQALQLVRQIEQKRPMICVYEDIDAMVDSYGESEILALLDGELQIGNVVNVATCNYPERLDPRFTNRPGRFDRLIEVPMPLPAAREAYFRIKAPELEFDTPRLRRWVEASEGWSIAHLRELVIATLELGEDDGEVIARLIKMHEVPPSSDQFERDRTFGFRAARQAPRMRTREFM